MNQESTVLTPYSPPPEWRCSTPVERARHLFQCFYAYAAVEICEKEGVSAADIRLGGLLAQQDKADRRLRRSVYGDPAYGSWPSRSTETKARCINCGGGRRAKSNLDPPDLKDCECELSKYEVPPRQLLPGDDPATVCECGDCTKQRMHE